MTMTGHWADVLTLRPEVLASDGSVGELQMSLSKAVYQTVPVPYARVDYYTDITEPTARLVGFLGRVARRLGVHGLNSQACFHLDSGMGGGKSHAVVGLWHMTHYPQAFFATDLGRQVAAEAGAGGYAVDLQDTVTVVLTCDGFSPGRKDARFGPATDLFGRFLWLAFDGHPDRMGRWQHYMDLGPNKTTLHQVFAEIGKPVLILIDELMDYVMALTDATQIGGLPGEKAFLNALTDAVDDQPNVALVLVMIRSDEDQAGYHPEAEALREYLTPRLQRNGETVSVTEPADFPAIIRRRLFELCDYEQAARDVGVAYRDSAGDVGWQKVFNTLGAGRAAASLPDRVVDTYPFHPDLFSLVSQEWTFVQAFQRVRSTVQIFARTATFWVREHQDSRWSPDLIGVGDLPLQTDTLEAILSSGVLAGNDRAIQGYRAVATNGVIHTGGGGGTAVTIDGALAASGVNAGQPHPAVRMATACFAYSLVRRPGSHLGATKAELLASIAGPGVPFTAAEETFNALTAPPTSGGLGALEQAKHKQADRYYLSIKQTLTMYHANALGTVSAEQALQTVWDTAQRLASKGPFQRVLPVSQPTPAGAPAATAFAGNDSMDNHLLVLDPRRWTLLNGKDALTRADLNIAFGVTPGLVANNNASMVAAVATTARRERAKAVAKEYLAWKYVTAQLNPEDDEYPTAVERAEDARKKLDDTVRWAYQHFAYLLASEHSVNVEYRTVLDGQTALNGNLVWTALIAEQRAVQAGGLDSAYVAHLIETGGYGRDLTLKELFALPYQNPAWPLIPSEQDLRHAIFALTTLGDWMIANADGTEAPPSSPQQIQTGTMQQTLTPRPEPEQEEEDESDGFGTDAETGGDDPDGVNITGLGGTTTVGGGQPKNRPSGADDGDATGAGGEGSGRGQVTYERTTFTMPEASVTDLGRRDAIWQFLGQLWSTFDPAKAHLTDLQMLGITITVNAREGDTQGLAQKANSVPNIKITIEPDDF